MGRSGPAALVSDEAVAKLQQTQWWKPRKRISSSARGQRPNSLSGLKSKWRLSYIALVALGETIFPCLFPSL